MRRLATVVVVVLAFAAFAADPHGGVPNSVGETKERVTRLFATGDGWTGDLADHQDAYTFSNTNPDGSPSRWETCEPITFQVNAQAGGDGALADTLAAVNLVSQATGIAFQYEGETTHIPTTADAAPGGVDVTIAWATPQQTDLYELAGDEPADGIGGPDVLRENGRARYVSGSVVLNPEANNRRTAGFEGGKRGPLLLHELGHLVGLGHTDDPTQIMAETANSAPGFGSGDLTGLRQLGDGCRS
jgi:hypothetical protein